MTESLDLTGPSVQMTRKAAPQPPLPPRRNPLWKSLAGSFASAAASVVIAAGLVEIVPRLLSWALLHAAWSGPASACAGTGACWAFVRAKLPFILFGIYPAGERWRPVLVVIAILLLILWTLPRSHWNRLTLYFWIGGTTLCLLLMNGTMLALPTVSTSAWGGLPVTLLLTILSIGLGFPLSVTLALGRQSRLPAPRLLSIATIEVVRGLPLLTLLFIASVMLPLMLPQSMHVNKIAEALSALTLFAAAYLAEVLRGGLQGVSAGQMEAARALGLSSLQAMRFVILPQAIRKVIPPLTNTAVVIVKNTSLVLVVGLFDLLSSGRAALEDPRWPEPYVETYLFVALIYFTICFGISRYSHRLERDMAFGRNA